jgi:hypothetical protein
MQPAGPRVVLGRKDSSSFGFMRAFTKPMVDRKPLSRVAGVLFFVLNLSKAGIRVICQESKME